MNVLCENTLRMIISWGNIVLASCSEFDDIFGEETVRAPCRFINKTSLKLQVAKIYEALTLI